MKIVYSTDQVYLHGGIEKMLSQKLNFLVTVPGVEVYLITTEQKGKPFCYPISNKVIHYDLDINYTRDKSYFNPVNSKKFLGHIKKVKNQLRQIEPDVLVVCNYAFDFYFIPYVAKGIKTIKEYHSSRYNYEHAYNKASLFGKVLLKINAIVEKKYTHLVVLNKDEQKHFKSTNTVVIPNSITTSVLEKSNTRKKSIIAAGRIAPVKQFDHLIEAWSLIARKFPDWEVHIYGEGDPALIAKLKKQINKLQLTTIQLMGATSTLDQKMKEASIYALTSATECFPMVLLESLACGLPIVSYSCPYGPKNIITNKVDGILVEANNISNFALEISNLIENESKRKQMEIAALKNIERFNENIVMQQWMQLFRGKCQ